MTYDWGIKDDSALIRSREAQPHRSQRLKRKMAFGLFKCVYLTSAWNASAAGRAPARSLPTTCLNPVYKPRCKGGSPHVPTAKRRRCQFLANRVRRRRTSARPVMNLTAARLPVDRTAKCHRRFGMPSHVSGKNQPG